MNSLSEGNRIPDMDFVGCIRQLSVSSIPVDAVTSPIREKSCFCWVMGHVSRFPEPGLMEERRGISKRVLMALRNWAAASLSIISFRMSSQRFTM